MLRYNTAIITNDERIEENLLCNNDLLDDNSTKNEGLDCMIQSVIIDLEITISLLFQNDEEINQSIWSLNVKQKQISDYILKGAKEKLSQTQGSETVNINFF